MISKYNLEREQEKFLVDLKKVIGTDIPFKDEIIKFTFGIKIKKDNIIELGLYDSKLSYLPESIGSLKSLQTLYLVKNQISKLPDTIGDLSSLKVLNLENNRLNELPISIGKLQELQELHLRFNKLILMG